jgi:hypothetical protein
VAHELECIALIALARGQGQPAAQLFGAAEALREAAHSAMTMMERHEHEPAVAQLRAQLGEAGFTAAWAAGRALSPDGAVGYALETSSREAAQ